MSVLHRALAFIAVTLFTCGAVAGQQQQRSSTPTAGPGTLINDMRLAQELPGLAVVVVRSDGQPQVYVSGERRIGKGDAITPSDRMHLDSLTKAITATVIGALAEQKRMHPRPPSSKLSQNWPRRSSRATGK